MERKYTVAELKDLINLSHQAIYDRIKLNKFNIVKERVDSRMTTFLKFSEEEWNKLINEVGYRIKNESSFNQVDSIESTNFNKTESQPQQYDVMKTMFEGFNKFTQELNQVHKDYKDEIVNLNLQTRLLEDSEKRKESEFLRQLSELKAEKENLLIKVEQLEKDNKLLEDSKKQQKKAWWKIGKN